jgi:hypothetical protein
MGLVFSISVYGQTDKTCMDELLGKSFISDGQDHMILVRNNRPTRLYVVFYPQFRYKLVVCCNNKSLPVEFKLLDNKGTVHFSNANKDYIRIWEFQFTSIMNAVVEIKLADTKIKEENIRLLIGYQTLKAQ